GVVGVELAGGRQQLGALGLRFLLGSLLHLDEERVGLGLGDEPHLDLTTPRRPARRAPAGAAGRQQHDRQAQQRGPPAAGPHNTVVHSLSLLRRDRINPGPAMLSMYSTPK